MAPFTSRDDKCPFGAWIYQGSPQDVRGSAYYEQIRSLHAKFHQLAGQILRQATNNDRQLAIKALEFGGELDKLSASLMSQINDWRDDLDR